MSQPNDSQGITAVGKGQRPVPPPAPASGAAPTDRDALDAVPPANAAPRQADEGVRLACYTLVGKLAGGLGRRLGEWLVDDPLGFARPGTAERQHQFLHLVTVRLNKHRRREWHSHVADTAAKLLEKKETWRQTGLPSCMLANLAEVEERNQDAKPFLCRKPLTSEDVKRLLFACHGSVVDWFPELTAAALLALAEIGDSSAAGARPSDGDAPLYGICAALLPPGDPADQPLPRALEGALAEVFLPSKSEPGKLVLGCLTPPFEKLLVRYVGIHQEYEKRAKTQVQRVRAALSRYRDGEVCDDAGTFLSVRWFCEEFRRLQPFAQVLKGQLERKDLAVEGSKEYWAFKLVYLNVVRLIELARCLMPSGASEEPLPAVAPAAASAQPPAVAPGPSATAERGGAAAQEKSGESAAPTGADEEEGAAGTETTAGTARAAERTEEESGAVAEPDTPPATSRPEGAPPEVPSLFAGLARKFPESLDRLVAIERLAVPLRERCRDDWPKAAAVVGDLLKQLARCCDQLHALHPETSDEERRPLIAGKVRELPKDLLAHLCGLDGLLPEIVGENEPPLTFRESAAAPEEVQQEHSGPIRELRDAVFALMRDEGGYREHEVKVGDDESCWARFRDELKLSYVTGDRSGASSKVVLQIAQRGYVQVTTDAAGKERRVLKKNPWLKLSR